MKEMTIPAVVENIEQVTDFVNDQLAEIGSRMKAQVQIDIAIDELFGNIGAVCVQSGYRSYHGACGGQRRSDFGYDYIYGSWNSLRSASECRPGHCAFRGGTRRGRTGYFHGEENHG